jgi:Holliday junction DNA helicase RuvB
MDHLDPQPWMGTSLDRYFDRPSSFGPDVGVAPPQLIDAQAAFDAAPTVALESAPKPRPTPAPESGNKLRPTTFAEIVGQARVKRQIERMSEVAKTQGRPMDHILLVGPSGTGKTTFAHVISHKLGTDVYQLEAPVSHDTLIDLAATMKDGDILFLDEIHQQAITERRGRSSATQPEVLFAVMEDHTLPTGHGVIPFPHITLIGATTDEGMLPDAFVNRFPIRPRLEKYSVADMETIAARNAEAMDVALTDEARAIFAKASRSVPREVNNYIRNAAMLAPGGRVSAELALEVLDLNGTATDGLTRDMQEMLRFLYTRCRRTSPTQGVRYQASVSSIATAIGKSRDVKAIQLRVEPYLIERGYVQVAHGGRVLTDAGIKRARELES